VVVLIAQSIQRKAVAAAVVAEVSQVLSVQLIKVLLAALATTAILSGAAAVVVLEQLE
jgi:hypothetical protein